MGSAEDLDGDGIGDVMPQERAASSERTPRNGDRQTVAPSPAHGCGSGDGTKLQIPVQIGDRLTDETGEGDGGCDEAHACGRRMRRPAWNGRVFCYHRSIFPECATWIGEHDADQRFVGQARR